MEANTSIQEVCQARYRNRRKDADPTNSQMIRLRRRLRLHKLGPLIPSAAPDL